MRRLAVKCEGIIQTTFDGRLGPCARCRSSSTASNSSFGSTIARIAALRRPQPHHCRRCHTNSRRHMGPHKPNKKVLVEGSLGNREATAKPLHIRPGAVTTWFAGRLPPAGSSLERFAAADIAGAITRECVRIRLQQLPQCSASGFDAVPVAPPRPSCSAAQCVTGTLQFGACTARRRDFLQGVAELTACLQRAQYGGAAAARQLHRVLGEACLAAVEQCDT